METPSVLDYSFGRPDLNALPSSVVGVCRYLRGSGKALTASEAAAIHASGRFIVLNDETTGGSALGGYAQGVADGAAAGAAARFLGAPTSCVIHPSVDFDEMASETSTVLGYLRGFAGTSGYGAGVYGEADVLDQAAAAGLLSTGFGWQASAWSGGRISSHAGLYQYLNSQEVAGAFVDFNRLINPAGLGAWWPNGLSPSGGGSLIGGFTLDRTDPDVQALMQMVAVFNACEQFGPNAFSTMVKQAADTRVQVITARDNAQQGRDAANIVSRQVLAVDAKVPAPIDVPALAAAIAAALPAASGLSKADVQSAVTTALQGLTFGVKQ